MICYVYILKSLRDLKYYYGSCENLEKRLMMHNAGKVRSTKSRTPFVLHYSEEYASRAEAKKENTFLSRLRDIVG